MLALHAQLDAHANEIASYYLLVNCLGADKITRVFISLHSKKTLVDDTKDRKLLVRKT